MEILNNLDIQLNTDTNVALGYFDGVHLGHRAVINECLKLKNRKTVVFSFNIDSQSPTKKENIKYLSNNNTKRELLEDMGVDVFLEPPFSSIKNMEPEEYVDFLVNKLNAKFVSCGSDYRFAKFAKGDVNLLRELLAKRNVKLKVLDKIVKEDTEISSTKIREFLSSGQIEKANEWLGYNYYIKANVNEGKKLGRTISFPTINQEIDDNIQIPKTGVYVSKVEINNKEYLGISNIGTNPTVNGNKLLWETHIIDFNGDLYEKVVKTSLLKYIREEEKFENVEKLQEQIKKDLEFAKKQAITLYNM